MPTFCIRGFQLEAQNNQMLALKYMNTQGSIARISDLIVLEKSPGFVFVETTDVNQIRIQGSESPWMQVSALSLLIRAICNFSTGLQERI